jgi:hypothetical protein
MNPLAVDASAGIVDLGTTLPADGGAWRSLGVARTLAPTSASQSGGPPLQRLGRCRAFARDAPASRRSALLAQAVAAAVQAMSITRTGFQVRCR